MKRLVIVTDLDGTLLEPDGSVRDEVFHLLQELRRRGVPVHPITSKTSIETAELGRSLGLSFPAGVENGAGIVDKNGVITLGAKALPLARLREVAYTVRQRSPVVFKTIEELDDVTLSAFLGLPVSQMAAIRARCASLPLLVDPQFDQELVSALPSQPKVRLLRGNRFLHLQGDHDKAEILPLVLHGLNRQDLLLLGLGDSPNDLAMLQACDVAYIVSSRQGGHPLLQRCLPKAKVTPMPHGAGWVWAVERMVNGHKAQL